MNLSPNGYNLTETSEGCVLKAYPDTGGVWTIGYGHTKGVKPGQRITQEIADSFLHLDIQYAVSVVNAHGLPCSQGQFDALVDFVFNVGPTQFLSSHLYSYHKSGEYDKAADEFPKWKYDNGKVEPGLVERRAKEKALYTLREPVEVHQQTVEPVHSVPSAVGSVSQDQTPSVVQSSVAQPVPASSTAPVSNNGPSGFLSQVVALARNLLAGKDPQGH